MRYTSLLPDEKLAAYVKRLFFSSTTSLPSDNTMCCSPSELLWIDSKQWGPLNGSLLSLSYGFGKIQLVTFEQVRDMKQGGVIDLPGLRFLTGVMRGRFNPSDGQLYVCGMSAWGTNQVMKGGAFYRVRYTGKSIPVPVKVETMKNGMRLIFANQLDEKIVSDTGNFRIQSWEIRRSRKYGSERYNIKTLPVTISRVSGDKRSVELVIPTIQPTDIITVGYDINDVNGNQLKGKWQGTIYNLQK